jgi:hypothetical protein
MQTNINLAVGLEVRACVGVGVGVGVFQAQTGDLQDFQDHPNSNH